jgi:hypothetical protein
LEFPRGLPCLTHSATDEVIPKQALWVAPTIP